MLDCENISVVICSCAFRNCQQLNEPGCAVRPGWRRHPFYVTLHAELTQLEELQRHR